MIHWKNKPIDQLSKEELQDALLQSVNMNVKQQGFTSSNNLSFIFSLGFSVGALIIVSGFTIGSIL